MGQLLDAAVADNQTLRTLVTSTAAAATIPHGQEQQQQQQQQQQQEEQLQGVFLAGARWEAMAAAAAMEEVAAAVADAGVGLGSSIWEIVYEGDWGDVAELEEMLQGCSNEVMEGLIQLVNGHLETLTAAKDVKA